MNEIQQKTVEEACRRVVTDLGYFLDIGDFGRASPLLTDDFVWERPGGSLTQEGLGKMIASIPPKMRTVHFYTNIAIDQTQSDEARGRAYFLSFVFGAPNPPVGPLAPASIGSVDDFFKFDNGAWRLSKRYATRFDAV